MEDIFPSIIVFGVFILAIVLLIKNNIENKKRKRDLWNAILNTPSTNTSQNSNSNFDHSFPFFNNGRSVQLSDVKIGDRVKLWNKPGTNIINVYLRGYELGDGIIGQFENREIASMLKNNVNTLHGVIEQIYKGRIFLEPNMQLEMPD
jgi:hypothetical protein